MNILPVLILMPILIIYDECYAPVQTSKQQHPAKSAEDFFFFNTRAGDDRRSADARPQVARQPQHRNNITRQARGRNPPCQTSSKHAEGFLTIKISMQ